MSQTRISSHFQQRKSSRVAAKQSSLKQSPSPVRTRAAGKISTDIGKSDSYVNRDLELLKSFDLDYAFGPCHGIERLERWQRASDFNFNPPQDVHDLLVKHPNDERYQKSLWHTTI